jgi:hypothetical protein
MSEPQVTCRSERRRFKIRERKEQFNGLDYVDVIDGQTLRVYFINRAPQEDLQPANVVIKGGRRIRDIRVVNVAMCRQIDPSLDDCMVVRVDKTGDFSPYTLCLVKAVDNRPTGEPYPGFDPRYACLEFSFKVICPSDLDCKQAPVCPPALYSAPEINYLTKDYASFRQLILDRLALTMPGWQERHVPDLGVALVELLAYAGDHLSYYQDAVATEAYLATARQRISVRRHARLVDYQMHEGCNARAWVHVHTSQDLALPARETLFITGYDDALQGANRLLSWEDLDAIPRDQIEVFAPMGEASIELVEAHNELHFYTWGDRACWLPRGATAATLVDAWLESSEPAPEEPVQAPPVKPAAKRQRNSKAPPPATAEERPRALAHLKPGDVLILEEVVDPGTGRAADANPARRHAVRLIDVTFAEDKLYDQPVVEITWAPADALPFPFCISTLGPSPTCALIENVSVARGNVLLVDHGRPVREPPSAADQPAWCVPATATQRTCEGEGRASFPTRLPGVFSPTLRAGPLTFCEPLAADAPAARMLIQDPRAALPAVELTSAPAAGEGDEALLPAWDGVEAPWTPRRDLLASGPDDAHFVVEVDNAGRAHLRFGDGELGRRPAAGLCFEAAYRMGNGLAGNVGAEAIRHIATRERLSGVVLEPRNPLPARGGSEAEPMEDVKLYAPHAFRRRLERAVTPDDYAAIVMRDFAGDVQRAAATLRWNGSWYEVLVAVDARGAVEAAPALLDAIAQHLARYRRTGHDLLVKSAQMVPLDVELMVCVQPGYLAGHVKVVLLDLFSNRVLADGRLGFFHPDNLTFGEGIYLSKLAALAQATPGVASVVVNKLERLYEGPNGELEQGVLALGPLEIARLDNDPSFPEHGRLTLVMGGGR